MRSLWTEINPTQDLNSHGKPLLQRLNLIKAKASFRALVRIRGGGEKRNKGGRRCDLLLSFRPLLINISMRFILLPSILRA